MTYNSLAEHQKRENEIAANGERAINHYPLDAQKLYQFRTWGEFFSAVFRGFVVTVGLCTVGFIFYCVGRMLWNLTTR